jgi:hypothetical protein
MQETKYQSLEKILSVLLKMPMIKSILQTQKKLLDCRFFQNMWSGSMVRHYKSAIFEAHLEKLSQSRVYQALVGQHTAVELIT